MQRIKLSIFMLRRFTPLPKSEKLPQNLSDVISPGDPTEIFHDLHPIGEGSFGEVYKATDIRTLKQVAVKQMDWILPGSPMKEKQFSTSSSVKTTF